MEIKVDLPEPFSPKRTWHSPARRSKSTLSSARKPGVILGQCHQAQQQWQLPSGISNLTCVHRQIDGAVERRDGSFPRIERNSPGSDGGVKLVPTMPAGFTIFSQLEKRSPWKLNHAPTPKAELMPVLQSTLHPPA